MADNGDEEENGDKTVIGTPLPRPAPGLSAARRAPVPPAAAKDAQKDVERTVFGPLPGQNPSQTTPEPSQSLEGDKTVIGGPANTEPTPSGDGEKTVIGGPVPQLQTPPRAPPPETGQTVVGGGLPPPPLPRNAPAAAPHPGPGRSEPVLKAAEPAPRSALPVAPTPVTEANTSNPFVLASTDLLTLLGRLRMGMTDTPTPTLYDHVMQAISRFEQTVQSLPVDQHDALVAKYALCGTVDDIAQNLPDIDQAFWRSQPLVSRFFAKRDSNVGFFQEAQKAIQSPATRYNLLEFMLICLNLGFEGQYRNRPGGAADLASIRNAILETLRRTRPQEGRHLSVMWEPVRLRDRSRLRVLPLWAVTAMATLAVVAFFATLSSVLNRDGAALAESLYALHPVQTPITLERAPGPVFEAPASQFERLGDSLGDDLAAGRIELSQLGNFIIIRLGNAEMFASGSAEVNPDFRPLGARIAAALDTEPGPLTVLGYTDSRGAFNTNMTLSVARAEAVAEILREELSDPLRVEVEGRGPTDPIADNSTEEGRAKNRRVEIKLAREGTF